MSLLGRSENIQSFDKGRMRGILKAKNKPSIDIDKMTKSESNYALSSNEGNIEAADNAIIQEGNNNGTITCNNFLLIYGQNTGLVNAKNSFIEIEKESKTRLLEGKGYFYSKGQFFMERAIENILCRSLNTKRESIKILSVMQDNSFYLYKDKVIVTFDYPVTCPDRLAELIPIQTIREEENEIQRNSL